ncbi:ribosome biogenesis slx9-like isoform X1 [Chlorella sorokiniana]|uniref:Ribosome biogenesis slx9-like isoform X1 n=1 Tax=Chlorella sorokiniana TaxID=3076 RepID=A0A2P6TDZ1_CHLSO|nr:ribosome biogenesis slx9-like isoform X1 [Chlorella sorokiniana]|eukprot:PRW20857.1 ribosome biogenesis slx9-like isoform X1 [Chlorella sorokiniana]
MVRAKLAAKARKRLLEGDKSAAAAAAEEERDGPAPPQHVQRKLTRKVKFLERVAATGLTTTKGGVAKKKKQRPSVALTDLASLTASLNETAAGLEGAAARRQFGKSVGTLKAREKVAEVETQRLQAVLQHPQFQANPLAAVASHLAATLPAAPLPAAKGPAKDAATLRREKKKRRKERARQEAAMGDD